MGNLQTTDSECNHEFTFLRQIAREPTWHNFVTYDVFFCKKCLTHKEIEAPKEERRRW